MTGELTGKVDDGLRAMLEHPAGIRAMYDMTYDVLGHKVLLRGVGVHHPTATIVNPEAVKAALVSGTAAGRTFELRGADGSPWRAYVLDRVPDPDRPPLPVALGIPGVEEDATTSLESDDRAGPEPLAR